MALPKSEIMSKAKDFLLYIDYGTNELTIGEVNDLLNCFTNKLNSQGFLWSTGFDPDMGENLRITIFATGLELDSVDYYLAPGTINQMYKLTFKNKTAPKPHIYTRFKISKSNE